MKIYKIGWVKLGGGGYVPPDPCVGGDYYKNLVGFEIVTAPNATIAKEAVELSIPGANVKKPKLLIDLAAKKI